MRMYDLIHKKKQGKELSYQELEYIIEGYVAGILPDYQMAALLMAIYFQGMTREELGNFTQLIANSGEIVDLSSIEGQKIDKHSTGGVGDKTTLIVGPIVASCGVKVAKMSGRGLGHTGGTIDKLEGIDGFRTSLSPKEFVDQVNRIGIGLVGQSGDLAPADKLIYGLRDVTATVDSIPLIASSIMSKKLAASSDGIVLDVKFGSGAFMKGLEESILLAKEMMKIGYQAGKEMAACITNMDIPLGYYIGNRLEILEAIDVLKGNGPKDLRDVSIELATWMIVLGRKIKSDKAHQMAIDALESGRAWDKFQEMIDWQGGNLGLLENKESYLGQVPSFVVPSHSSGYIERMDTQKIGIVAGILGAGRKDKESLIDYDAGIILHKKVGDYVKEGEALGTLYTNREDTFEGASTMLQESIIIGKQPIQSQPLIYQVLTRKDIE